MHAETSEPGTSTSLWADRDGLAGKVDIEGSRTLADLKNMVGALISIPRDGYVIVGMVVPESAPVLELRSLVVEDEKSRSKLLSMSSHGQSNYQR